MRFDGRAAAQRARAPQGRARARFCAPRPPPPLAGGRGRHSPRAALSRAGTGDEGTRAEMFAAPARVLLVLAGYVYPGYLCFKQLKKPKRDEVAVADWCTYWMCMAALAAVELLADAFVSWAPLYYEAKIAFVVYLWHPRTRGAAFVYESMLAPRIAAHEENIDRALSEAQARAGDALYSSWQRGSSFTQQMLVQAVAQIAANGGQAQTEQKPAFTVTGAPRNAHEAAAAALVTPKKEE